MYKIYINETPLILGKLNPGEKLPLSSSTQLYSRYSGSVKSLLNFCDMLEKSDRYTAIFLLSYDFEKLVSDFQSLFKKIQAAGGIVQNNEGKLLVIYRRGSWDLPKGKIDPGESIEEAAIREVQEETGIQALQLGNLLNKSYHTYRLPKGKRVLKETFWFEMSTNEDKLTPETEEDIEQAIWIDPGQFLKGDYPMYKTIRNLVEQWQKQ